MAFVIFLVSKTTDSKNGELFFIIIIFHNVMMSVRYPKYWLVLFLSACSSLQLITCVSLLLTYRHAYENILEFTAGKISDELHVACVFIISMEYVSRLVFFLNIVCLLNI